MRHTYEEIRAALSRVVRDNREARDWSLLDLARASGAAKSTLSKIENGKGDPCLGTLEKISTAYGLRIADFFGEIAHVAQRTRELSLRAK